MKTLINLLKRPSVACVVISLLVLGVVLGVRAQGWLQQPELIIYDHLVKQRMQPDSTDDRIALIGMTEQDLKDYGYALTDELLAKVLRRIGGIDPETKDKPQNPVVIGLDMYRDLYEPRNNDGKMAIDAAFKDLKNLIAIRRFPIVDPPPALRDDETRVSVNNLTIDTSIDGLYRRGTIFLENKDFTAPTFSFALTAAYLDAKRINIESIGELWKIGNVVVPRLTPDAGGYVGINVVDYEYLTDYESPRRFRVHTQNARNDDQAGGDTPHDYSFGQVLRNEIPANALTGKIVFVATVMQTIKDSNPTPIHENLRGVQQHIMMTHQLLEAAINGKEFMSWWPEWAEVLYIALAALLGGVLGLVLHSPWRLAPALAILLAVFWFAGRFAFHERVWIPIAAPLIVCAISAAFVVSLVSYLQSAERDVMKSIFSKHVSPAVVEALWKDRAQILEGGRVKPMRVVATVLFTDLKGFSTTSEKMDPETLMNWMVEYFDGIASLVEKNGGTIDKFIGDAIMGVFGVPIPRTTEAEIDTDASNAVECALAMRAALSKLNAGWREAGRPTTAMRVGIHTGPLVAGHSGSTGNLDYTVLGDAVNTAARLEGAGKDFAEDDGCAECTILISDATCARLKDRYSTRLLGPLALKGKAEKVIVHSVIARKEHK